MAPRPPTSSRHRRLDQGVEGDQRSRYSSSAWGRCLVALEVWTLRAALVLAEQEEEDHQQQKGQAPREKTVGAGGGAGSSDGDQDHAGRCVGARRPGPLERASAAVNAHDGGHGGLGCTRVDGVGTGLSSDHRRVGRGAGASVEGPTCRHRMLSSSSEEEEEEDGSRRRRPKKRRRHKEKKSKKRQGVPAGVGL